MFFLLVQGWCAINICSDRIRLYYICIYTYQLRVGFRLLNCNLFGIVKYNVQINIKNKPRCAADTHNCDRIVINYSCLNVDEELQTKNHFQSKHFSNLTVSNNTQKEDTTYPPKSSMYTPHKSQYLLTGIEAIRSPESTTETTTTTKHIELTGYLTLNETHNPPHTTRRQVYI